MYKSKKWSKLEQSLQKNLRATDPSYDIIYNMPQI